MSSDEIREVIEECLDEFHHDPELDEEIDHLDEEDEEDDQ